MVDNQNSLVIHGEVAPGFEPVKALFARNMQKYREENAQLCIYVGESRVVDLWASTSNDPSFDGDSLINVFSSGKSLESIAMASLVSRGLMNFNDRVADYWPAFANGGKGELLIADVMRHEAGLAALQVSVDPDDLLTSNIKQNRIGRVIEEQASRYREGDNSRREYHAITRGWIVNEIFRRIDPDKRTLGEFLQETLTGPLAADIIIGVPEARLDQIAKGVTVGPGYYFKESLKPNFMGRRVNDNLIGLGRKIATVMPSMLKGTSRGAPPPFKDIPVTEAFNLPQVAMGETPSANAHCSARGLARLAAAMANGGNLAGAELVNETGWRAMHEAPVTRNMGMTTSFTQGGVAKFDPCGANASLLDKAFYDGREGYYGWMGMGGSIFQWHPGSKIGFAFVPTALHIMDFVNERGKAYQIEVARCLARQQ